MTIVTLERGYQIYKSTKGQKSFVQLNKTAKFDFERMKFFHRETIKENDIIRCDTNKIVVKYNSNPSEFSML